MALLEVKGLSKAFVNHHRKIQAVADVSFSLQKGECLGLVGESGCGKSTTANLVARLLKEDRGAIYFKGRQVSGKRLRCIGKEVQMVFQNPADSFDPRYTVLQCIMQGAASYKLYDKATLKAKALELMAYVGLKPSAASMPIVSLSGGECQRVAIARALICEPELIIFDEATSALDVSVQAQIIELLKKLKTESSTAFLFITHDLALTAALCDRIAVMLAGRIVEYGITREILDAPRHPYTQNLLNCVMPISAEKAPIFPSTPMRAPSAAGCPYYAFCPKAVEACGQQMPALVEKDGRQTACLREGDRL